jgi:hypothetical protein
MIRRIAIVLAAIAAILAFAPKVSHELPKERSGLMSEMR